MPKKKIEFRAKSRQVVIEPDNPVTICTISYRGKPTAFGLGVRKHGDAYDLETGCRMALRSALRMIRQEEIRKAVWAKYLELFPPKQRVKPGPLPKGWGRVKTIDAKHIFDALAYLCR